ncbi:Deoxyhypusine synthase [Triticum urartu]|uniref:Deoxyhypusine synthase n=1 Tax=Triticum urartu TaxID=4572 RepID=M7ZUY8_TRIUA|nr:Deoxyhypusine synthase [Triticum urartu]
MSLPTGDVRMHREMASNDLCTICNASADSGRHSLLDCNMARAVWALVDDELVEDMISNWSPDNDLARVLVTMWSIWYKINVDEDLSRDGHRGVAAAVCRDINVAFLGASAVEGLVILLILRLLHAMSSIKVASDFLEVISNLRSKASCAYATILRDIDQRSQAFEEGIIQQQPPARILGGDRWLQICNAVQGSAGRERLDWRLSQEKPSVECDEAELDPKYRESVKCKIFLGFTSNLVSSGIRDVIRFLVQHHMVDVIVTSAGGIEEDLIKCLGPTYRGDFSLPGALLRSKGLNRIGNLLLPNDNYCKFEEWIMPVLDQMLLEQSTKNVWTPSKVIGRLGKEINDESSYLYWAHKVMHSNERGECCPCILVDRKRKRYDNAVDLVVCLHDPSTEGFSLCAPNTHKTPLALTDGSIGDMLFCHAVHNPGLIIDIVQDVRLVNDEAIHATPRKTGVIILGGGLPKHHICNANMLRNGADYAVYINTAQEFDGSDSGAHPDEAVSWGKIKGSAEPVKVYTC